MKKLQKNNRILWDWDKRLYSDFPLFAEKKIKPVKHIKNGIEFIDCDEVKYTLLFHIPKNYKIKAKKLYEINPVTRLQHEYNEYRHCSLYCNSIQLYKDVVWIAFSRTVIEEEETIYQTSNWMLETAKI